MQNSSLISSIYNSKKILVDILQTQGYDVSEYTMISINEINQMYNTQQMDMLLTKNDNSNKIYITYYLTKSIPANKNVDEIIEDLFVSDETTPVLTKNDTLMIVTNEDPNDTLIAKLKYLWDNDGIFIIVQSIKRLQFNILNHSLVPPHRILSETEVNNIKQKYNITNNYEFPEICRFDPVAQVIGIRPGQICEILRSSKSSIQTLYYRICV
jgi:DNA-directed RNA polymerase subunit H